MGFLMWLEETGFGTFVRESTSILGYPTFIVMHTMGLSVVVGTSAVVAARVLGIADGIPLQPLSRLFPLMWFGFAVNTFSGSGLAAATATGQFTNPIFILKLILVLGGVICMLLLQRGVFRDPAVLNGGEASMGGKALAGALLGFWMLAMIAGRLIAYAGVILGR
jgi:hypothetical protein